MKTLNSTEWEILNATADDWENLEQIFQQLNSGDGRLREAAHSLREVADGICNLVESGSLEARSEAGGAIAPIGNEKSYVWRGWFRMSPQGREAWAASPSAAELTDAAKKVVPAAP